METFERQLRGSDDGGCGGEEMTLRHCVSIIVQKEAHKKSYHETPWFGKNLMPPVEDGVKSFVSSWELTDEIRIVV